ncbi:MAG: UDP-N-acetylglucosamine 2-epimerase (non-hydrolyzing) [Bacteroidales bacterium]|nr:MAG: UDP-N-acetylglucosamine 2-epimerase (non-hydrolyzing) [Bacteroidales bacterium]
MKVLSVIGSRSQLIRAGAVSHQLFAKGVDEVLLLTAQHTDDIITQVFFEEMDIPVPKYSIGIQSTNQGAILGRMIEGVENAIIKEKPEVLLVYGDSNSALAGALAANKHQISIAHVEAGLRIGNLQSEGEVNRLLTDRISNLLFCPSSKALENLKSEGFENYTCKIFNVGDILQEVAYYYGSISSSKSDIINRLGIKQTYALATINRHEYYDDLSKLKGIVKALNTINREQQVIVPLHQSKLRYFREINIEPIFKIVPYLNYFDMVELLKSSNIVLTDSGTVQREAFYFGKCSVMLRHDTEWAELVQNGYSMLGSTDSEFILIAYNEMISRKPDFTADIYGKGKASERIAEHLTHWNEK